MLDICRLIGGAAVGALSVASQAAAPAIVPTAVFAELPTYRDPMLSPSGRQVAAEADVGGNVKLVVMDTDQPESKPMVVSLGKAELEKMHWAGESRLLLTVGTTTQMEGFDIPVLRLLAVDIPSGAARPVDTKSRGLYGGDVLYADPTGAWAIVASQDDAFSEPSVKRVDLATGEGKIIERKRPNVWDWFADEQGVVRAGVAYDEDHWTLWYRDKPDEKLKEIRGKFGKEQDSSVDRFTFGVGDQGTIVTNEKTGRFAAYVYNFQTGEIGAPIYENPTVDITGIDIDPISGKVNGAWYEDDRRHAVWVDPEFKRLQDQIDKALPGAENDIAGLSQDRNRVLVWSGGASDPGAYYLLDRTKMQMHPVFEPYPGVDPALLAAVTTVHYKARDGLEISAYLTLPKGREAKNLALVLLPHGGPFARDHWQYDPLAQLLANRGYAVLQPEFRGSTGFGKDFVAKGYGEFGRKMQDDIDDGVDWLAKSGQIDPKRVCIVGLSYGGYAAMWGAIRSPNRYRCAASWAGPSDLGAQLKYDRKDFAATRYFRDWQKKVAGEGKVDLATVSPITYAAGLKVPLLIAHGEKDQTVPPKQSYAMVTALQKAQIPNVTTAFYADSGHDFGSSATLNDFLSKLDAFLAKYNPATP